MIIRGRPKGFRKLRPGQLIKTGDIAVGKSDKNWLGAIHTCAEGLKVSKTDYNFYYRQASK